MKSLWRIAVPIGSVALICAAVVAWHFVHAKAAARTLMEQAKAYRVQAEHGDANAQYELARLYYQGKGVPQNYTEAFGWYRKAAEQGNAKAQYGVGFMYEYGKGVPQDYAQGASWCGKAADQGYAKAQFVLGWNYYYGEGVPRDYTKALALYRRAADQGDAFAQDAVGYAYAQGNGVPKDDAQAVEWYRRAADQGYAKAQDALGYVYSEGKGVPRDYTQSARWYRKAAKQGDEYARRALTSMNTPLTALDGVSLSLALLGSTVFLIGSIRSIRNRQQCRTALAAVLVLLWVGLNLYPHYYFGVLLSLAVVNAFFFAKSLLSGISVGILFSIAWPRALKYLLTMCGILFVVFNIYAIMHFGLRNLAAWPRLFYSQNAFLIGMAFTSLVLWRWEKKGTQSGSDEVAPAIIVGDGI